MNEHNCPDDWSQRVQEYWDDVLADVMACSQEKLSVGPDGKQQIEFDVSNVGGSTHRCPESGACPWCAQPDVLRAKVPLSWRGHNYLVLRKLPYDWRGLAYANVSKEDFIKAAREAVARTEFMPPLNNDDEVQPDVIAE